MARNKDARAVITIMTTLGYGNFVPQTTNGRLFTAFYAMVSCALMGYWMNELTVLFCRPQR